MFVEFVDQLRCPARHEASWLVLAADHTESRHVRRGTLGCPVCRTRYRLTDGVAWLMAGDVVESPPTRAVEGHAATEWPMRLAALLDLADAGGMVGLLGAWGEHASALAELAPVEVLVIDAPGGAVPPGVSGVMPPAHARFPIADGALRAVAAEADADPARVAEAARLVRTGGRVLAPVSVAVPPGVRELARDGAWWVGERDAAPAGVVSIASRRR